MQLSRDEMSKRSGNLRYNPRRIGSNIRESRLHPYHVHREAEQASSSIESDGTSNYTLKDAPGQNSRYIPPGDHRDEFYRLGTYGKFPNDAPVQKPDMAASGFYYTGYKDRVKCFSCGIIAEDWEVGDDGTDRKWHRSSCGMANGTELQNIALPVPNYRTLLREIKGLRHSVATTSTHGANDIRSNLDQMRLREDADSYPKLVLANVVDPEFERKLRSMNLRSEYERRKTFERFPTYPAPNLVGDMAKEGLFYLGNLDRTQCFSCSGVLRNWGPNDSVSEQHGKHFTHCRMARGLDCDNIPMSATDRSQANTELAERLSRLVARDGEPPDPTTEEQQHLALYLPCNEPVNPHMQSLQRRIETFNNNWPRLRIRAPIEQIAKAGFYYLDQGDKTKCFYCNGGLQNWDQNDEPWTEHAKWFPRCQYILRQKGIRFVQTMVENHPNLNRPLIRNPVLYENIPPFNSNEETPPVNPATNVDMRHIRSMGFSEDKISRALARATARGVQPYTQELIQYLLEDCGQDPPPHQQNTTQDVQSLPIQSSIRRQDTENTPAKQTNASLSNIEQGNSIAETVQELSDISLCRRCRMSKADIVYTPCGHLVVCESCSKEEIKCIVCHSKVHEKIKVYRA